MNQLIFDNADKGYEVSNQNIEHLHAAMTDAFEGILRALVGNVLNDELVVLSGCEVTENGSTYTVTAGFMYYQGEIFTVEPANFNVSGGNTGVWQINQIVTNLIYGDGNSYPARAIRTITLTEGAPGSGLADWNQAISKAWITPVFIDDPGSNAIYENNNPNPLQYRKLHTGKVEFRGVINEASGRTNQNFSFNIPQGYKYSSTEDFYFTAFKEIFGNTSLIECRLTPSGQFIVPNNGSQTTGVKIYLENVSYYPHSN